MWLNYNLNSGFLSTPFILQHLLFLCYSIPGRQTVSNHITALNERNDTKIH